MILWDFIIIFLTHTTTSLKNLKYKIISTKKFQKFKIWKFEKYFSAGRVGVSKFLNTFVFVLILFQIPVRRTRNPVATHLAQGGGAANNLSSPPNFARFFKKFKNFKIKKNFARFWKNKISKNVSKCTFFEVQKIVYWIWLRSWPVLGNFLRRLLQIFHG